MESSTQSSTETLGGRIALERVSGSSVRALVSAQAKADPAGTRLVGYRRREANGPSMSTLGALYMRASSLRRQGGAPSPAAQRMAASCGTVS